MTPQERTARELIRILESNVHPARMDINEYMALLLCGAACVETLLDFAQELPPSLRRYTERRELLAERIIEIMEMAEQSRRESREESEQEKSCNMNLEYTTLENKAK